MYDEFPSFTAYLLRKMSDIDQPTLSIGDSVKIQSVKRHQPKKWLGKTGNVAWINAKEGLSEYRVAFPAEEFGPPKAIGTFQRHQLRKADSS